MPDGRYSRPLRAAAELDSAVTRESGIEPSSIPNDERHAGTTTGKSRSTRSTGKSRSTRSTGKSRSVAGENLARLLYETTTRERQGTAGTSAAVSVNAG